MKTHPNPLSPKSIKNAANKSPIFYCFGKEGTSLWTEKVPAAGNLVSHRWGFLLPPSFPSPYGLGYCVAPPLGLVECECVMECGCVNISCKITKIDSTQATKTFAEGSGALALADGF